MTGSLRRWFVQTVYANHNASPSVRRGLTRVLETLPDGQWGVNVGAGFTRVHPRVFNLDVSRTAFTDVIADATKLPFADGSCAVVVTQETLEHTRDPFVAIKEIARVLCPGGALYCQLPFVIGFHPGPTDFWRFTVQGIQALVTDAGLTVEETGVTVGGATGYYRISVEFWSILLSAGGARAYPIAKALFAILLFPMKWLDWFFDRSAQRDRIAGGYFVLATKPFKAPSQQVNADRMLQP